MKYFGTDGFRGTVCESLNPLQAFEIGRYLGYYYKTLATKEKLTKKPSVIIGKDTRLSGDVLEHAIASGVAASGCDAFLLGVCPTPAISYLVRKNGYDFGIMISASHNPYQDNGIKVFNETGFKLEEIIEEQIEAYLDGEMDPIGWAHGDELGRIVSIHETGLDCYATWLSQLISTDFHGMRILVDLANGSATSIAREVLSKYHASVDVLSNEPNGYNINDHCGSTHLGTLQAQVKRGSYDIGLAFDGDADRLLAVDEHGALVDGDAIMYLCAKHLHAKGQLKEDTLVTTVMSNLGLYRSLERLGIKTNKVQVGDKYVSGCIFQHGYTLGGEQSGHIIFANEAVSGDGLLTALHLLSIVKESGKKISELLTEFERFPQLLKNVHVEDKNAAMQDERLSSKIKEIEEELQNNGRILVRASGTEQLIRVMVEAPTTELCENYVSQVMKLLEKKGE